MRRDSKHKKASLLFVIVVLLFTVLLCGSVASIDYLLVKSSIDPWSSEFIIDDLLFVVNDNPFYVQDVEASIQRYEAYSDTDRIVFYDRQGSVLLDSPVPLQDALDVYYHASGNVSTFYLGEDQSNIGSLKIFRGQDAYFEQKVNFCDGDGVCEACFNWPCANAESFATCSDCRSGSADHYCDLERDGICDPDCLDRDGDCLRCDGICLYYDMKDMGCDDIGGKECSDDQECKGGEFVYLSEEMRFCCLGGTCFNLGEYVETTVEMQSQPSLTIAPSGLRASDAQRSLGDYCTDRLKGSICDPYEFCDGRWVEYYQGAYCCIGQCGWDESRSLDEAYIAEMQNETSRPLSPEDMASLYNITYDPEDDYSSPAFDLLSDPEAIRTASDKDKFQWDMDDQQQAAQKRQEFIDSLGKVMPKVPEKMKGSGFVVIVIALLSILVVVGCFVWLFTRSARKKLEAEQQSVQPPPQQPPQQPQTRQDLQQSIDSLLTKGYDYARARDYLLKQGYDQKLVYSEIQKNYQLRRQSSQK